MSQPIDAIVNVNISLSARSPSVQNFGTPMIVGARAGLLFADKDRVYSGTDGMVSDGFTPDDAEYKIASAMLSQNPTVTSFKIGRRASAWTQLIDLTPASPATGKVYTFQIDGYVITYIAQAGDTLANVCTNLAALINLRDPTTTPPTGGTSTFQATGIDEATAIIKTGGVSSASPQVLTGPAALNGSVGTRAMVPARCVKATFSNSTDWDATTMTVKGLDANGVAVQDTILIPNNGSATVVGTNGVRFSRITEVDIPAQTGAGGTYTLELEQRTVADGSSGTHVRCTAQRTATLVTFKNVSQTSNITMLDSTSDAGIATDLAAINAVDSDWYGLLLDSNGAAEVEAAAAWIEADGTKILCAQTADTAVSDTTAASDTTSVAAILVSKAYFRTHLDFMQTIGLDFISGGIDGSRFPRDPGSDTWEFKALASVSVSTLTPTQTTNLGAKNVGYYVSIANLPVTQGGKVASGEWVDVVRYLDKFKASCKARIFGVLASSEKVPYTDQGVGLILGEIRGEIDDGIRVTAIDGTAPILVTAPLVADIAPATRATRVVPGIQFKFRLAGAVHAVVINGTVTE